MQNTKIQRIKESREWRREHKSLYAHDCDVMERGIVHILKSMNQPNDEIIRQLMTLMQLSEKGAYSYLKAVENNEM